MVIALESGLHKLLFTIVWEMSGHANGALIESVTCLLALGSTVISVHILYILVGVCGLAIS